MKLNYEPWQIDEPVTMRGRRETKLRDLEAKSARTAGNGSKSKSIRRQVEMGRGSSGQWLVWVGQLPTLGGGGDHGPSSPGGGIKSPCTRALSAGSMATAVMGLTLAPTDDVAGDTSFLPRVGTFLNHNVSQ